MSQLMPLLRELHSLHLRLRNCRDQLEEAPRRLRTQQAKIERQQKELERQQERIKEIKVAIHAKEVSVKETEQQISKHQSQMAQASSTKEYNALRSEIERERQARQKLEDEILELMLEMDEQTEKLPDFEAQIAAAKEEYHKAEAELKQRMEEMKKLQAETEVALRNAEAKLEGDLRETYDRLVGAYGADALAPVRNRSCGGCYIEPTPQQLNDLKCSRLVTCKSCGRLLYLEEDPLANPASPPEPGA